MNSAPSAGRTYAAGHTAALTTCLEIGPLRSVDPDLTPALLPSLRTGLFFVYGRVPPASCMQGSRSPRRWLGDQAARELPGIKLLGAVVALCRSRHTTDLVQRSASSRAGGASTARHFPARWGRFARARRHTARCHSGCGASAACSREYRGIPQLVR